jgi:hypothetical protein
MELTKKNHILQVLFLLSFPLTLIVTGTSTPVGHAVRVCRAGVDVAVQYTHPKENPSVCTLGGERDGRSWWTVPLKCRSSKAIVKYNIKPVVVDMYCVWRTHLYNRSLCWVTDIGTLGIHWVSFILRVDRHSSDRCTTNNCSSKGHGTCRTIRETVACLSGSRSNSACRSTPRSHC